jgi:hypothetical protein
MAGLVPAIYVLPTDAKEDVDGRIKSGHDEAMYRPQRPTN